MRFLHISLPSLEPIATAATLAEMIGGVSRPFPPVSGGRIVTTRDPHGFAIEVVPEREETDGRRRGFHALIAGEFDLQHVSKVAVAAGWPASFEDRGPPRAPLFSLLEVWVEGLVMLEFMDPPRAAQYAAHMAPENLDEWYASLEGDNE